MCQTSVNVSPGRFHSDRFQKRVAETCSDVPDRMECPRCHHSFDIVVSRRQIIGGRLSRRLLRHYRCRVCECRFSQLNPEPLRSLASMTFVTAACATIVALPSWLF